VEGLSRNVEVAQAEQSSLIVARAHKCLGCNGSCPRGDSPTFRDRRQDVVEIGGGVNANLHGDLVWVAAQSGDVSLNPL